MHRVAGLGMRQLKIEMRGSGQAGSAAAESDPRRRRPAQRGPR
jgi:hypothetical protein